MGFRKKLTYLHLLPAKINEASGKFDGFNKSVMTIESSPVVSSSASVLQCSHDSIVRFPVYNPNSSMQPDSVTPGNTKHDTINQRNISYS